MNITLPEDLKWNVWYRGSKTIKVVSDDGKSILMSNGDKFTQTGNDIYLNKFILTNIPGITQDELLKIYKYNLFKRGYKFLD